MEDYRVGYVVSEGAPVAVFLDSGPGCNAGMLMSYIEIGEHGEASLDWIREQPLADAALYTPLHAYLRERYAEQPGEPLNLVIDQAAVPR